MHFRFLNDECDVKNLSPLTLAFIGDGVFNLFVKEKVVCSGNRPAKKLHEIVAEKVSCKSQAFDFQKIKNLLTETEMSMYKRGRNANCVHKPKNASKKEYSLATGVEALFGFLYLSGDIDRLRFLFKKIYDDLDGVEL